MSPTTGVPPEIEALETGTVLYDRHRNEYFAVERVDDAGVALRRDGTEYYVPHSLFAPWQDSRLVPVEELSDPDLPGWL
jgi:hypothetical protein